MHNRGKIPYCCHSGLSVQVGCITSNDRSAISLNHISRCFRLVARVRFELPSGYEPDERIEIDGDSKISRVSLEQLKTRMQEEKSQGTEVTLVVRADKEVQHGRVVEIIDIARNEGLNKLAIGAQAR